MNFQWLGSLFSLLFSPSHQFRNHRQIEFETSVTLSSKPVPHQATDVHEALHAYFQREEIDRKLRWHGKSLTTCTHNTAPCQDHSIVEHPRMLMLCVKRWAIQERIQIMIVDKIDSMILDKKIHDHRNDYSKIEPSLTRHFHFWTRILRQNNRPKRT